MPYSPCPVAYTSLPVLKQPVRFLHCHIRTHHTGTSQCAKVYLSGFGVHIERTHQTVTATVAIYLSGLCIKTDKRKFLIRSRYNRTAVYSIIFHSPLKEESVAAFLVEAQDDSPATVAAIQRETNTFFIVTFCLS